MALIKIADLINIADLIALAPRRARMVVYVTIQRVNGTGIPAGSSPQKPSGHAPGWLFAFRLAFSQPEGSGERLRLYSC